LNSIIKNSNAYILAGGNSRRFGTDKALYRYKDKPLISYAIERLNGSFKELFIIAKESEPYKELDPTVVEDIISHQTPMAGLYTGLSHSDTEWNFFLGCDMPLISLDIVEKLADAVLKSNDRENVEVIVPRTPGSLQPLAAFYHKSLVADFFDAAEQVQSLKGYIRSRNTKIIDFQSDKPFTNVNTKEQLQRID